ncbi:MAG: FKBP-type peptidyl-prolyl cis-trans isomerase [Pseudomonadales bacterium]|nr:FKBP-type peptidyl-prolyl cis-trans isomerase [Pseudomonadales bacterium]
MVFVATTLLLGACDQSPGTSDTDAATTPAAGAAANANQNLATDAQKASYSIGYTMAGNVRQRFAESIDAEAFARGISDRLNDRDQAVSPEEANDSLQAFAIAQQQALTARAGQNQVAGDSFLKENAAREGVVTLESGLQYQILTPAEGPKPVAADTVTTHYHGTLIDGTVFDSSYERGEPASFPLNGVISGWTEGLQLMSVGAKYRFFVPPDLAYGGQDRGPIPANSTLVFDVELLAIESADGGS